MKKDKIEGAMVSSRAAIYGEVEIGEKTSIFPGTVLRGDQSPIYIGKECNIQENTTVHVDREHPTLIKDRVTIGHQCIIHGCTIEEESLIGMGSILMNGVKIGSHCLVGAGSLLTQNTVIEAGMLVLGRPGKAVRPLTQEEIQSIQDSAKQYQILGKQMIEEEK